MFVNFISLILLTMAMLLLFSFVTHSSKDKVMDWIIVILLLAAALIIKLFFG